MPTKFKATQNVWIPSALLKYDQAPYAMTKKTVLYTEGRSIVVDHDGNDVRISSKLVHGDDSFGITVVRVGDIATDKTLLDPLARTIFQFCQILLPEERRQLINVRTRVELETCLEKYQSLHSLVVLLGHGTPNHLKFVDGDVTPTQLANILNPEKKNRPHRTVLSLACRTGTASFGREFSKAAWCQNYIGPHHSVNGVAASQFCQTLLGFHFLEGLGMGASHKEAAEHVPGGSSFRRWQGGRLAASRYSLRRRRGTILASALG